MGELSIQHSKVWKIAHWWALFVQSIWCYSLKISEELCVMTLKDDAKFKEKLTCGLKDKVRNLVNFHGSGWKSENLLFDWILLSKAYIDLNEKNTEELCFMTLKNDAKFKENLTIGSKNNMRNLVDFHRIIQKSKNFPSMDYFCPKYLRFELKK